MRTAKKVRRFLRARDGATAMEFALIAPVLLLLMFGIIEFSLILLVSNIMESATSISARLGKTGYAGSGVTREQTIIASIAEHAGTFIDTNNLVITSTAYQQFDQIHDPEPLSDSNGNGVWDSGEAYSDINGNGQWDADMGLAGYGGAGDIVVYTVSYPWSILTPIMRELIGTDGVFTITSRAVVKNEPY